MHKDVFDYNKFPSIYYTDEQREDWIKHNPYSAITRKDFDELRKIIDYIAGQGRLVTSKEVSEVFGIQEKTTGWMNTRATIKDGMRHYAAIAGIPIGAGNKGYFLIEDADEVEKYADNLHSRIRGMEERIVLVTEAWQNRATEVI
jgi:hypothetical protein